jgi:hypothetical protein
MRRSRKKPAVWIDPLRNLPIEMKDQVALDTKEAAAFLSVSVGFLSKLRLVGGGPRFVRCGRKITYRLADLRAWQEANSLSHTSARRIPA